MLESIKFVRLDTLSATDLLSACADGRDEALWEEFVRRFHQLIAIVALRTVRRYCNPQQNLVEDLIQETYVKLCANRKTLLSDFTPEHPDSAYSLIKVVTANTVHDHFKSANTRKRGSGVRVASLEDPETASSAATPDSSSQVERQVLLNEIDGMLQQAVGNTGRGRDRTIFWLYYRHGLTAKAISSLPGVGLSTKGVESTILRLTRIIRERVGGAPASGRQPPEEISAAESL